jgi:hypothetical protein
LLRALGCQTRRRRLPPFAPLLRQRRRRWQPQRSVNRVPPSPRSTSAMEPPIRSARARDRDPHAALTRACRSPGSTAAPELGPELLQRSAAQPRAPILDLNHYVVRSRPSRTPLFRHAHRPGVNFTALLSEFVTICVRARPRAAWLLRRRVAAARTIVVLAGRAAHASDSAGEESKREAILIRGSLSAAAAATRTCRRRS